MSESLGGGVVALRCYREPVNELLHEKQDAISGGARGDPVHQSNILGVSRAPRKFAIWWWHLPPL